jgi:hypothetical protein
MTREEQNIEGDSAEVGEPPVFAIAWSPDVLSGAEYARLIGLLGDLVRATGALGVERVRSQMVGGNVGVTTLV